MVGFVDHITLNESAIILFRSFGDFYKLLAMSFNANMSSEYESESWAVVTCVWTRDYLWP